MMGPKKAIIRPLRHRRSAATHRQCPLDAPELVPADPLWKRAPTRDAQGRLLSDFLMIIPRIRHRPPGQIQERVERIQAVLDTFGDTVVFAELNLRLATLWVTVKPVPGICLTLPTAIKVQVPEALLVGQQPRDGR